MGTCHRRFCVHQRDLSACLRASSRRLFVVRATDLHASKHVTRQCSRKRPCLLLGQFSQDDYGRFVDICKLFEANSRLDFITVSRYYACLQQASAFILGMLLDVGDCFHCCIGGFRTTFACSQQLPEAYLCLCAKEQVSRISGIDQSTATAMHVDRGYKVAQRGKVQEQKQQLISLRPFLFLCSPS